MRIALAAALLLVLQTVVGALALGMGPGELDAFGNPLCVNGVDHSDPGNKSDHGKLPNCCTLGCPTVSHALGSPPEAASLPAKPLQDAGKILVVSARLDFSADDHRPGNPRAPPHAI